MKRISAFLLAVLLLGLTACGTAEPGTTASQEEGFTFTYNGTKIAMNAEAAPVIAALGEPKRYTEEPSCAFEGLDKTYFYGSFYLSTYPLNGKDYVYSVWFADDTVATEEGVRIGSVQTAVEAAFGADSYNGSNAYTLTKGSSRLTVILADGTVSSVQYGAIVE